MSRQKKDEREIEKAKKIILEGKGRVLPQAHARLAELEFKLGHYKEAAQTYERAAKVAANMNDDSRSEDYYKKS